MFSSFFFLFVCFLYIYLTHYKNNEMEGAAPPAHPFYFDLGKEFLEWPTEKNPCSFSHCKNQVKVFIQHTNSTLVMCTFSGRHEAEIFKTFEYPLLVCKTVNWISKVIKNNCNCVLVQMLFSSKREWTATLMTKCNFCCAAMPTSHVTVLEGNLKVMMDLFFS